MAAYRWVYDSCHLHVDCQEPGSAPEPYARIEYGLPFLLISEVLIMGLDNVGSHPHISPQVE